MGIVVAADFPRMGIVVAADFPRMGIVAAVDLAGMRISCRKGLTGTQGAVNMVTVITQRRSEQCVNLMTQYWNVF